MNRRGVGGFVDVLRRNGLGVGIDASRLAREALAALDPGALADEPIVRGALRATLLKKADDRSTFDELFERYFGARRPPAADDQTLAQQAQDRGLSAAAVQALGAAGGPPGLVGDGAAMEQSLQRVLEGQDLSGLKSPLQVGYFAERLLFAAGAHDVGERWAATIADKQERAVAEALYRERLIALRKLARRLVGEHFELNNLDHAAAFRQRLAIDRPFSRAAPDDEELLAAIERLCRRLHERSTARLRRARRGRIDLRTTMRSSMATQGVVFAPRHRRRRRERPEVVLICDVSDSVRTASAFMLRFVYAVSDLFRRVRSFMFVAQVGESTALFQTEGAEAAIERVLQGDVVPVFENSDYGRAFTSFAAAHLDSITRRTSVIILGDGRCNYRPDEAWVVEELRRRAKKVWWVCPEPRENWGFGDSRMNEYARHVDEVFVVRSVRALYNLVDRLSR